MMDRSRIIDGVLYDERSFLQTNGRNNKEERQVPFWFMIIGGGANVSYNALVMAYSFFQLDGGLGKSVLPKIARCHNALLVFVMLLLLCSPSKPTLSQHLVILFMAYAVAAIVDGLLFVAATREQALNAVILYSLVALNGAATGAAQALGASLSGIFDTYSAARGVGLAQLRGFAMGLLIPTLIQLASLPLNFIFNLYQSSALSAACTAFAALFLVLSAIFSIIHISRTPTFSRNVRLEKSCQPIESQTLCHNPEFDTIGKCVAMGPETRAFLRDRFAKVFPLAFAQFVNMFALVLALLFSTKLPIIHGNYVSFWSAYLPTLIIATNNIFAYIGRSIATPPPTHIHAIWPLAYFFVAPLGLAFVLFYRHTEGSCLIGLSSNLWPIVFYSVLALGVGRATVVFSQLAQLVCGHNAEFPCPIVAQINVIAVDSGSCAGAFAFS
uniref:Battenin n=1 Tax=Aureoumbra lagunensis TaxID=44058 RepID=A0A7S3NKH6_9STRA|mmetsp:Transcript_5754/g.8489  ORF Transcript_5754/g.8489 Transcript_5754/m.8489 type:complete len:441 (+) Transcript_5754:33-1355(+)